MQALFVFLAGVLVCKYGFLFLDLLFEWFATYVNYKISRINFNINALVEEQQQQQYEEAPYRIGFALPDEQEYCEEYEGEDEQGRLKLKNKK